MKITLTFDGGAGPTNPGKGYGSFLAQGTGPDGSVFEVRGSRIQFGEPLTSNQAEWMSLINGLKHALVALRGEHYGAKFPKPESCRLIIRGDSKLVIQQVKKRWKCKVAHLKELQAKADWLLTQFGAFEAHWHPREKSVELFGH